MKIKIIMIFLFLSSACTFAFARTINISPTNASVFFQVQHDLGYTIGYFKDFSGTVELSDDNAQLLSAEALVQVATIDTRNSVRDEGLKSGLFLDVEKFPRATYKNGSLTLKGITKPVILKLEQDAPSGRIVIKGNFNRNDYGITYNKLLPQKKKSIGEAIEIIVEIEDK